MSDKSRGVVLGVAGTLLVAAVGGVAVSQASPPSRPQSPLQQPQVR
jgi:hypothetical protein